MFASLFERGKAAAERRAAARADALASAMQAEAPRGLKIARGKGGVTMSGRGLARRFATEPALRWLVASLMPRAGRP